MSVALLYRPEDPNPGKAREFVRVAGELSRAFGTTAYPVVQGADFLRAAARFGAHEVDHLVVVSHGFTTKLGCSSAGVAVGPAHAPRFVTIEQFVDAWVPVLAPDVRVSLCACMCSRTPARDLRRIIGRAFGSWDPVVHDDGGETSFSGLLRDALCARGVAATVRGHTTAAHVTYNPALREHGPVPHEPGRSLFLRALGPLGVTPTWATCRRFNGIVKVGLAERWVLWQDDEIVPALIRQRWALRP